MSVAWPPPVGPVCLDRRAHVSSLQLSRLYPIYVLNVWLLPVDGTHASIISVTVFLFIDFFSEDQK